MARGIAPTGRAIDIQGVVAYEVDPDGRVIDFWLVNDRLSIATQLGATLSTPPTQPQFGHHAMMLPAWPTVVTMPRFAPAQP